MTVTEAQLIKRVEKLETLVARLSTGKRQTWVKASDIKRLTGWNNEQMRYKRDQGLIVQKRDKNGISYLLESLNPVFIKNV